MARLLAQGNRVCTVSRGGVITGNGALAGTWGSRSSAGELAGMTRGPELADPRNRPELRQSEISLVAERMHLTSRRESRRAESHRPCTRWDSLPWS